MGSSALLATAEHCQARCRRQPTGRNPKRRVAAHRVGVLHGAAALQRAQQPGHAAGQRGRQTLQGACAHGVARARSFALGCRVISTRRVTIARLRRLQF